jgi:alpha-L-fucosidase 2
MLLQSQNNELHLLPALPDAWHDGAVRGMVARGNFVVDIEWKRGTLAAARILARNGGLCVIRTAVPIEVDGVGARSRRSTIGYVLSFDTVKGKSYQVRPARKSA